MSFPTREVLVRTCMRIGAVLVLPALLLAACGGGSSSNSGSQVDTSAAATTTTEPQKLPPRTNGPVRPSGDPALQAGLFVADDLVTPPEPDPNRYGVDYSWKFGTSTLDDETDLCGETSPFRSAPAESQAHVSFIDFFGGNIDERIIRYGSADEAARAMETLRAQADSCDTWSTASDGRPATVTKSPLIVEGFDTWGDDVVGASLMYAIEGTSAPNSYVAVRRGAVVLRLHTAYNMGPVLTVLQYAEPALAKAEEAGIFG